MAISVVHDTEMGAARRWLTELRTKYESTKAGGRHEYIGTRLW